MRNLHLQANESARQRVSSNEPVIRHFTSVTLSYRLSDAPQHLCQPLPNP